MLSFLKKPYPFPTAAIERFGSSVIISGFVLVFLWIFQPFELHAIENHKNAIILGYGVTCLLAMLAVNFTIPELIPSMFDEEEWNTGREILWVLVHLSTVAFFNAVYSDLVGVFDLSTLSIFIFFIYTVLIGIFPIAATIFLNQKRLHTKYEKASEVINNSVQSDSASQNVRHTRSTILSIPSESGQIELEIESTDFYFVKAEGNYVEVFFKKETELKKLLMRNTMKNIDLMLTKHSELWRCHRSYIVNMQHIEKVSGNAQGYSLHLTGTDHRIPVSRQLNEELKRRMES
ncbi:MAG: LytTR family transcriptional regulator DNA-binding domain-containing protein [Saprospiraceae bacterium]|nr:LytTR family transcriptional regulator DNA-binding domain-containing protein [Saprospiraceae bacterium]